MHRALVGLIVCCFIGAEVSAQPTVSLGRDFPEAVVFLQMARRGLLDYSAQHGSFPQDLSELVNQGFTAYEFPTGWQAEYSLSPEKALVRNLKRPGHFLGQSSQQDSITVTLPAKELYRDERHKPAGEELVLKCWNFPGAEWLHAGYSWTQVEEALRVERIYTHCNWMTAEYNWAFGVMPNGLSDLEQYLGCERNSRCWSGVQVVNSLDSCTRQKGAIFVGWEGPTWIVAANCGPELLVHRWTPRQDGHYSPEPPGIAY